MIIDLDTQLATDGNLDSYRVSQMRMFRDSLLAQSDWTQLPDSPLTDAKKTEWATYRQALRDFPSDWVPSNTANFPDKPL